MKKARMFKLRNTFRKLLPAAFFFFFCSLLSYATSIDGVLEKYGIEQEGKTIEIKGTVADPTGEPLVGVTVSVRGSQNTATMTDANGIFNLTTPSSGILIFSYVGYLTQEVEINKQTSFDIILKENSRILDEVVVVGYGSQKKVNLTGSISSVQGDVINERTFSNTSSALQGMASGLTIIDRGGAPGSENSKINIRGIGTLNNANPLIIVDNVPVTSINDVLPHDIESISVLKDAASSAIYGSRAANGVILITTKRGNIGKTTVNYNFTYSVQKIARMPKSVDARTYMDIINEGYNAIGQPARYSDEVITKTLSGEDPFKYPWTNWLEEVFQDAPQQSHSLSINGGSEKSSYLLSINYVDTEGIIKNIENKRYSLRANNDYKLLKNLKISTDLSFIRNDNSTPYRVEDIYWMYYSDLMWTSTPYYPDGSYTAPSSRKNPIAARDASGYKKLTKDNFTANVLTDWEVINNLHIKGQVSANLRFDKNKEYAYKHDFVDYYTGSSIGKWENSLFEKRNEISTYDGLLTVDYTKTLGKNFLSGIIGYQGTTYRDNRLSASRKHFDYNDLQELDLGSQSTVENSGGASEWELQSIFGRLNYSYAEKYLLEANFRYDGSSRFHKNRRWGFFPSFSGGWRMSEESFMKNVSFLDNLKLRASWGQLGNQNIDLYQYYETIALMQNYNFGGSLVNGAAMTDSANEFIKWETSTISNIGLDADFLNGKFSFSGEIYRKKTKDILLKLDIPYIVGLNAPTQNAGVVENNGWEINLTHRNTVGEVKYSVNLNLSDVRNKITDMKGIKPQIENESFIKGEGYAINSLWGYEYIGLLTQEDFDNNYPLVNSAALVGSPKLRDRNDDGIINADDKIELGETIPRYTYGMNLNVDYKGFYIDAFFQGVGKNNSICGGGVKDGAFWGGFIWEDWADRFHPDNNPDGKFPRVIWQKSGPSNQPSNFWVQDASYLRLKNLQIGYNLPKNIISKIKAQKCRLYVASTNVFTITKTVYDPEFESGTRANYYPQSKTFSLGLDIMF